MSENKRLSLFKLFKLKAMSKPKKPISSSQAQKTIRELCEKLGINYTENQQQSGTASIQFLRKNKGKEKGK